MGVGASGQNQALWVEVGRFPGKQVATMSLDALVANGHGPKARFRIRKVTIRQPG